MDNFTEAEQKRLQLIQQIQKMYQTGISIREITRRFQINRQTTKKYLKGDLTLEHYEYLWNKYSILQEIEKCIREFREIFRTKKMPLLYLFIDRYKYSSLKELASFASGLEKDISAVENAVASDLSNAFVEGTNNKVKMVKRTMYGRCSKKLLAAKLMYNPV